MKHVLYLFLLLAIYLNSNAQCSYNDHVPDELYRGRYKPAGMLYGNPYTMFNKSKPGWSYERNARILT